jgi:hypothetical protein
MHQMRRCHIGLAAAVLAFALGEGRANAQQAAPQQPQTYGYATPQAPYASGQSGASACYPERIGCQVFVCPNPCMPSTSTACQQIQAQIPPIRPAPACHEVPVCVIQDELPPPPPRNVVIYRNCYVPIQVQQVRPPKEVTPVNIEVRWREVHILCGPDGRPLTSQQTAELLKELNAQVATTQGSPAPDAAAQPAPAQEAAAPVAPPTNAPAPAQAAAPTHAPVPVAMASAPAPAPTPAQADAQAKKWFWLAQYNAYGYGYQRDDGYFVIDQGSLRATMPQQ